MTIGKCLRIGAALCLLAIPAFAPAQLEPLPVEVRAALEAAWARHPAAELASRELQAAQARARAAAQPVYNPELEFGAERADSDSLEAGASLTLDLGGKRRARSALGAAELDLARARFALSRRDFAQRWLAACFALATAEERAAIAARQLLLVERFAELASQQLRAGDISPLERDLALLAREEARVRAATLAGQAARARAALRIAGGDAQASLPELARIALPEAREVAAAELARLPEAVLAGRQSLAAEARVLSAERERRADPTVGLRAGQVDTGVAREALIGLSLSIPLHVRNDFRAEVAVARSEADGLAAGVRLVDIELRAQAQQSTEVYRALLDAWRQWQASGAAATRERAELLERLWKAGELSTSDHLVQLRQALDTALAGAELHGELLQATLSHLSATGRLDAWTGMPEVSGVPAP